jgi:hypothetical protein
MPKYKRPEYDVDTRKYLIFCTLLSLFILITIGWEWALATATGLFLNYFVFRALFDRLSDSDEKLRFTKHIGSHEHALMRNVEKNPSSANVEQLHKHLTKK